MDIDYYKFSPILFIAAIIFYNGILRRKINIYMIVLSVASLSYLFYFVLYSNYGLFKLFSSIDLFGVVILSLAALMLWGWSSVSLIAFHTRPELD